MTEEPSTLSPLVAGEIRFHQASPPPLPPGGYTVTVTQDIIAGKDTKTYQKISKFTVSGPRFFLNPAEIYSVYPPTGQFGPFDNTIPHIVFTRRTLPWERSAQSKDAPVPWMALLVLGKDDFPGGSIPSTVTRKVAELLTPSDPKIQGPRNLKLEPGQTNDDLCNTIDLPIETFATVAPAGDDLPFLAHVREVKTGGKETLSLKQDGWFAVVLANRLPATSEDGKGETNLVCLASLEGFLDLLPTADGKPPGGLTKGKTVFRLAVLASWTFTCHGQNDFKTKMQALDDKSVFRLDPKIFGLTADTDATTTVKNALEMGYVGLNHVTRLGEKTVSWYRGPLVPMRIEPQSPYKFISCADEALRYDFRVGLFAAEYAAAYELGRMMALQSRSFATAMYRFRNAAALNDVAKSKQSALMTAFGAPEGKGTLEDAVAGLFVSFGGGSTGEASRSGPVAEAPIPPEVTQFLARAVLLYGVPFEYLVPDERMLPPESIRFFYLDPGWNDALIQGAAGVGRTGATDTVLDERIRFGALRGAVAEVRESGPASQNEPTVKEANWPLTGFLMRSELVDGWQGVEMRAYGQDKAELAPLRIDRLAPDVMLCIFNGAVVRLTVKQPPEGLHFGLSPKGGGQYQRVSLRRVTADVGEPGAQIPKGADDKPIDAPMRGATRVVKVAALAETFRTRLSLSKFTSAEFSVQMVESPGLVEFEPRAPPPVRTPASSPQAFSLATRPSAPRAPATAATGRRRKLRR